MVINTRVSNVAVVTNPTILKGFRAATTQCVCLLMSTLNRIPIDSKVVDHARRNASLTCHRESPYTARIRNKNSKELAMMELTSNIDVMNATSWHFDPASADEAKR